MGKLLGIVCAIGLVVVGFASPALAAPEPSKVALIYGDSLVWESSWEINAAVAPKHQWSPINASYLGTAPCDWLATLDSALANYKPSTVTLATAGNSITPCMDDPSTGEPWPMGSAGYLDRYKSDLDAIFSEVTATGAKMVFVEDPPMLDATRDAALTQVIAIATTLAGEYHGVSIVKSARSQLSKSGKYSAYKPCLKTETAAMGCASKQIAIRTVSGDDQSQIGLHLCPSGLTPRAPWQCQTYSSGEFRYGKVLASAMTNPPKPIMP